MLLADGVEANHGAQPGSSGSSAQPARAAGWRLAAALLCVDAVRIERLAVTLRRPMRSQLLSRLKVPPRRFRRLVIVGLLLPTWFFSWGVRTEGCSSDRPVPLLPPMRTSSFADPQMAWVIALALLFVALPFVVERVQNPRWRALLNVGGALLGGWLVVLLAFIAAFAQALFGRIVSLSAAGVVGLLCLAGLALEALSWVGMDIAAAWRARRGRTSGVHPVGEQPSSARELVGEEGVQPGDGGALEDEG